jgi:3-mercaptopyruvate sulfurtransferase SseA
MTNKKRKFLIAIAIVALTILACNAELPQSNPTLSPTQPVVSAQTQTQTNLPQTEADVPRVSVEDAKAAFDSGEAVIVDVRSAEAYAEAHIAGALSIPLNNIEFNPSGVALNKNQWIITYCT